MEWERLLEIAESVVAETIVQLPAPVQQRISEVPVLLERAPGSNDLRTGIEPDTLGYFDEDGNGLAQIRLWLENIRDYADGDPDIYADEVATTLLHEIGHVLGWDEDDLDERGLS